jgi:hypothetical protein
VTCRGKFRMDSLLLEPRRPSRGQKTGLPDPMSRRMPRGEHQSRRSTTYARMESGMPPCGEHGDHFPRNLFSDYEHPEDLEPEYGFWSFQFQRRRYPERPFWCKSSRPLTIQLLFTTILYSACSVDNSLAKEVQLCRGTVTIAVVLSSAPWP